MRWYYFLSAFGVAATQAPFLSAPPFGSHFIFAFRHSAFVLGVDCAKAVGESASAPTMATAIRNFMSISFPLSPPEAMECSHEGRMLVETSSWGCRGTCPYSNNPACGRIVAPSSCDGGT